MNMAKILLALTINFLVVFNSHAVINSVDVYKIGTRTGSSTYTYSCGTSTTSTPQGTAVTYNLSSNFPYQCRGLPVSFQLTQGSTLTYYYDKTSTCPANSTLSGSTCTCESGYTEQAGACIQQTAIDACENTTEQDLVYKATNNAEVKNPVLIPTSEYQDLCHDSCRFQLQGTVERCFALISDTSPRPGYCQQSYTPTYQICTAGEIYKASLQITPPADVTTCPTNHTLNDFDICTPDELICPADQAPNAQNICENVACQAGYIRETPESPCTSNACPAGQYRLDESSPCQQNPTCPTGQYGFNGQCQLTACPAGFFRSGDQNACAQLPVDQIYSSCPDTFNPVGVNKCATDNGVLSGGHKPSVNKCQYVATFNDDGYLCTVTATKTQSQLSAEVDSQCATNPSLFQCSNKQRYLDGYRSNYGYTGATTVIATTTPVCPLNHSLQSNGFCRPDICASQPDSLPACSAGGLYTGGGSTGGGSTVDMAETNTLLTNIKKLLDGTDIDGTISDGLGDTLTQLQQDAFTTNLAALETWFDESPIVEAFESILPESPWQAIEDGSNGDCMYESQVLGHTFNLSLCDNQQVIHPLIAFMMFIAVSWGIMILIFEKDNG